MKFIKYWLESLNPEENWNYNNLEVLERQITNTIKQSGYVNVKFLKENLEELEGLLNSL